MSPHQKLRVLVVGASIAGPTAAYWLARAGAHVTVIERFPEMRTGGQNIDIRTVGVTVMRKMPGMEAAVRAKIVPMTGIRFVDTHNRPIATMEATGDPDQQSLVSEYEIMRGDLAQILVDLGKANKNIKYIFGEQIASINPTSPVSVSTDSDANSGPVTVTFANNTLPPTEFDLVVACDGSSSRTRALSYHCSVREHMKPINWWAAWFSIHGDADPSLPLAQLRGTTLGHAYNAPGGRLIMAAADPTPGVTRAAVMGIHQSAEAMEAFRAAAAQGKKTTNTTNTTANTTSPTAQTTSQTPTENDTAALKTLIASRFSTAGWLCPALTAGMLSSSPDFYATEIVQVKPPCLYNLSRRVVLVGDAGYAPGPTGTGTSLALAGAYVLAGEVARQVLLAQRRQGRGEMGLEGGGAVVEGEGQGEGEGEKCNLKLDLRAALEGYDAVMRPLVGRLQSMPPLLGTALAPQTWWGLRVRNAVLWFVCWSGLLGWVQGRFAGAFEKRAEDRLPEYEWVE